jgi:hypothetical protein
MGTATSYDDVTEEILDASAAWLPIVDRYRVGDFGKISGGVFHRMGNLTDDFGIEVPCHDGQEASIDFISSRTRTVRVEAGAEVPNFSAGSAEAKLMFEFQRSRSFVVKAKNVTASTMDSIHRVAEEWFDHEEYSRRIRIVSKVYTVEDALLLAAVEKGTKVEISGKAELLQGADIGTVKAGAGLTISSNKSLGLKLVGASGPIALDLFRVRILGGVSMRGREESSGSQPRFEIDRTPSLEDDL